MTNREMVLIFSILKTAYPKYDIFKDKEQLEAIITLWTKMFNDIPFKVMEVAVRKLLLESVYPPTIAEVRKQIFDITTSEYEKMDPAQAWGEVIQAIHRFGYYREAEAMAYLSPRTAKVIRYMGWQEICMCEELSVIRGQFLKMYGQVSERDKEEALIPVDLKHEIEQIASAHDLSRKRIKEPESFRVINPKSPEMIEQEKSIKVEKGNLLGYLNKIIKGKGD